MLKPICVACQRFFRPKKNDFYFTEGMPIGNHHVPVGKERPELWKPYKVWAADLWECEGCGTQILSGFGREPIAEKHHKDFDKRRHAFGADQFQVNDC